MKICTRNVSAMLVAALALVGCADATPSAPNEPDSPEAQFSGQPDVAGVEESSGVAVWCGLPVEFTVFHAGATWFSVVGPPARESRRNVITLTNPENGQSVSIPVAGRVVRTTTFNPDGSLTVLEEFDGLVSLIQPSNGRPVSLGAGRLVLQFGVVFLPGGGFELVDIEVLFDAGPHPDGLFLEGPLFCELVIDALT